MSVTDQVYHVGSYALHVAAMRGDDRAFRKALEFGGDINALDSSGRTVMACAVSGEDWRKIDASDASFMTASRLNVIRMLVMHSKTSLSTLNAPQNTMNGVTPLGMAAWLDIPDAVRVLLEDSIEMVSVDAMDLHGATALMYAARDGNLEVAQVLLDHGARPDFRDANHRTSTQFALAHPQILWLCETVLRRHRWQETDSLKRVKLFGNPIRLLELAKMSLPPSDVFHPPPLTVFADRTTTNITNTLVETVNSSDLSFLYSLLFAPPVASSSPPDLYPMSAPILVNRPDSNGWSPIHHCVSVENPSVDVLDALYCAGADVSLFTLNEHFTPLHCLARSAHLSHNIDAAPTLYEFTVHLIRDLRAPLSARDKNDETCIHVAAEYGDCIDTLFAFLDCDTTGSVRELRNARGLTPLEVAKPEFLFAFGKGAETLRSVSSLSFRTIRPTTSLAPIVPFSEHRIPGEHILTDDGSIFSSTESDISTSLQLILSNLRLTCPTNSHSSLSLAPDQFANMLEDTIHISHVVFDHFRVRTEEAKRESINVREASEAITAMLEKVSDGVKCKLEERGLQPICPRRRNRDSEDSATTVVSTEVDGTSVLRRQRSNDQFSFHKATSAVYRHVSISTGSDVALPNVTKSKSDVSVPPSSFDSVIEELGSQLREVEREICELLEIRGTNKVGSLGRKDPILKQLMKAKRKLEERLTELEEEKRVVEKKEGLKSATDRLKAWLKRKIKPDRPLKLEISNEVDEVWSAVGREVKKSATSHVDIDQGAEVAVDPWFSSDPVDNALRTSNVVLSAARRDLLSIEQCLTSAEQLINSAYHSISRAQRIFQRCVKKRETILQATHQPISSESSVRHPASADHFHHLSPKPSIDSLFSAASSARSSYVSLAATLTSSDLEDEDIRALRRLLLRKIEARISGAFDEIDKASAWLRIINEVVRGIKSRTYL